MLKVEKLHKQYATDTGVVDAATGAAVTLTPEAQSSLEDVLLNNRLRGELDGALAALHLSSPDRSERLRAAKALLDAAICFDFRGLYGDTTLSAALREWVAQQVSMYQFHSSLTEGHPYQSAWWSWPALPNEFRKGISGCLFREE